MPQAQIHMQPQIMTNMTPVNHFMMNMPPAGMPYLKWWFLNLVWWSQLHKNLKWNNNEFYPQSKRDILKSHFLILKKWVQTQKKKGSNFTKKFTKNNSSYDILHIIKKPLYHYRGSNILLMYYITKNLYMIMEISNLFKLLVVPKVHIKLLFFITYKC